MSDERYSCNGFFAGVIIGAIVGAAVGLLYAPKPGKETREMLKQRAEEASEKAAEIAEKAREAAGTSTATVFMASACAACSMRFCSAA